MKSNLFAVLLCLVGSVAGAAEHPGSDSDCNRCHQLGEGPADAPKVRPVPPGFFARLTGEEDLAGHTSLSCAGRETADGGLSGCHRPEDGNRALLAVDIAGRPVDIFCGRCHGEQREPMKHHPSYLSDKDGDGVAETPVLAHPSQEVLTEYAPANLPAPLPRYPDALVFRTLEDGSRQRVVALPLETVVEGALGQEVSVENVVTCSSCHNPHYGYRVDGEKELDLSAVTRQSGDALLRLRDDTNALCDACH